MRAAPEWVDRAFLRRQRIGQRGTQGVRVQILRGSDRGFEGVAARLRAASAVGHPPTVDPVHRLGWERLISRPRVRWAERAGIRPVEQLVRCRVALVLRLGQRLVIRRDARGAEGFVDRVTARLRAVFTLIELGGGFRCDGPSRPVPARPTRWTGTSGACNGLPKGSDVTSPVSNHSCPTVRVVFGVLAVVELEPRGPQHHARTGDDARTQVVDVRGVVAHLAAVQAEHDG